MPNEEFYDAQIAPKLAELGNACRERGMAFVCGVEYAPGKIGKTFALPTGTGLAMVMLNHCLKMGTSVDGYIIGLKRYAEENGIDIGASLYMTAFDK